MKRPTATTHSARPTPIRGERGGIERPAIGLGFRLRYEFHRKFAPYVRYDHSWAFGETADFAGGDASSGAFVFGVRIWR